MPKRQILPVAVRLLIPAVAVGLTVMFWHPLWRGGGLIGGDTYPYYFPQKTFYADELRAGRVPLWNPLVGHGYPVVAESQTGVLYPPNLLLYRLLPVNTAYNVSQIAHYVLAFLATWLLARRLGLGAAAAALASLVFVYSWFPARLCLEWAIIGGVYFPFALWSCESFLQTARKEYLVVLSLGIGLHLLAGHYNLAFITVLTVCGYSVLRLTVARERIIATLLSNPLPTLLLLLAAVVAGFSLAAVQLVPTWELKQLSQRAEVGVRHDPGYGHIPPWYLTQVVAPWMWYAPDVDVDHALNSIKALSIPSLTNKVEAQLYFGLVPLLLAVGGLVARFRHREQTPRSLVCWGLLGLAALAYTTGWLLPLTRHLPGFSYFMGPGRYGMVTTLAVALLAAFSLDHWMNRPRNARRWRLAYCLAFGVTVFDLWFVRCYWNQTDREKLPSVKSLADAISNAPTTGAPAWYADLIRDPPLNHREQSAVRQILAEYPQPVRMLSTFQNMPTLTGFAMTPTYLGLSPAEYYDPQLTIPDVHNPPQPGEIEAQLAWLRRAGVTHVLAEQPLDAVQRQVRPVWSGVDEMLNRPWGHPGPLFLYELTQTRGRAALAAPSPGDTVRVAEHSSGRVVIEVEASQPGEVILTDLYYPGWSVAIDGQAAEARRVEGMYRGVEVPSGRHTVVWSYGPRSVRVGAVISAVTLAGLVVVWVCLRRWNRVVS